MAGEHETMVIVLVQCNHDVWKAVSAVSSMFLLFATSLSYCQIDPWPLVDSGAKHCVLRDAEE